MVYGLFGIIPAYSTVFILFLSAYFIIRSVDSLGPINDNGNRGDMIANIREGIQFVFRSKILLGAFSLDMFAVLFGGAVAVLPVFASDILHTGPQGLGFLRACPAIGSIIMSLVMTARPPLKNTGRFLFLGVTGFGICIIGFSLSKIFWISSLFLFFSGVFDNISVVIRQTILQLYTPEEMKGRVASVNSIFIGSSNELGAFESGVAARFMGLIPSVIFGGTMTLLVTAIIGWKFPPLRRLSLKHSVGQLNKV
jgi:hypothetical protein